MLPENLLPLLQQPLIVRTRSQFNQEHASHPISWSSILILFSFLRLALPSGLFPSVFLTRTLSTVLFSLACSTHFTSFISLHLITLITHGEMYKSWKSFCNFHQPLPNSPLLVRNILIRSRFLTPSTHTLTLMSLTFDTTTWVFFWL